MTNQCQSERTTQRHESLTGSLLRLLRSQSFAEISVKDICQEAAIPRRTFYRYFGGKDELMDTLIRELLQECDLEVMPQMNSGIQALRESLQRFFLFWGSTRRDTLELLLRNHQTQNILQYAINWAHRGEFRLPGQETMEREQRLMLCIASVAGVFSQLFSWIHLGCAESAEAMAEYALYFLTQPVCSFPGEKTDKR